MLPRKNRISKNEFPSYKNKGIRFFSPYFTGVYYERPGGALFSVVVSKKVSKKAVERNRLRRVFYGVVEKCINKTKKGVVVVFYPKKEALDVSTKAIEAEINKNLQGIKIFL